MSTLTASSIMLGGLLAAITVTSASAANVVSQTGEWVASHGMTSDGAACVACHGADGVGQPEVGIPRLAGLSAFYINQQLGYFYSGRRTNVVMKPYAAALDDTQRHAVADYFASLRSQVAEDPIVATSAELVRGGLLFENGNTRTGLLGCSQCHGPSGLGVGNFSPRLAGQSSTYIIEQLQTWHDGSQRDPKGAYMQAIASHLSSADMQAVAAYAATLDPNKEAKP